MFGSWDFATRAERNDCRAIPGLAAGSMCVPPGQKTRERSRPGLRDGHSPDLGMNTGGYVVELWIPQIIIRSATRGGSPPSYARLRHWRPFRSALLNHRAAPVPARPVRREPVRPALAAVAPARVLKAVLEALNQAPAAARDRVAARAPVLARAHIRDQADRRPARAVRRGA